MTPSHPSHPPSPPLTHSPHWVHLFGAVATLNDAVADQHVAWLLTVEEWKSGRVFQHPPAPLLLPCAFLPRTLAPTHKGYEEVSAPAVTGLAPPGPGELVPIASLEPWAQAAFPGYKTLNRIQSRIFQTAYYRCVCCVVLIVLSYSNSWDV